MINLEERAVEKKSFYNRLIIIYLFFALVFIFFLERTYSLQISEFSNYEIAAIENKTKEVLVQPVRGIIYDRNGSILVNNFPSYDLIIKPWKILDLNKFIKEISLVIKLNPGEIDFVTENFKQKAKYNRELILKKNLTRVEIARFEVRGFKFPHAFIDERYSRRNNYPHLFSHAIGYVGGINNEQLISILEDQSLDQDETIFSYSNGFLIGKTGIENKYDKMLRGLFGKKIYEVDARGKFVKQIDYIEPKNGDSLFTSLDLESHKVAYEKMNNRRGAVVAIEIESGSIVTYLSSPSFSSNDISNGISSKEFNALLKDTNKPFFDRAAQGRYSPASTIKPAIGLFGLEESLIDWNFSINDPGYFILPEDQRVYRGWRKGGHGNVNLNKAMIVSSNTFFFSLAYQSDIDSLINHLSNFGFGENVCLDCFNPDVGLLPTPEWKMNNLNFGWFKGDTVNLGVGQGYLSATPLQFAYYASFIANKGINKRLTLIDSQTIKTQENLSLKNILNSDWDKLHSSMIGVIDDPQGTAKRLKDLKTYTVAAKSGTV
jgi:penicillin-binding protein 2